MKFIYSRYCSFIFFLIIDNFFFGIYVLYYEYSKFYGEVDIVLIDVFIYSYMNGVF